MQTTLSGSTCCGARRSVFAALSRATAKAAATRLRNAGLLPLRVDWSTRAALCERCPLRVIHRGKSYCGEPFAKLVHRGPEDGCGCPTVAKAKDPAEHCPLDVHHRPAQQNAGACNCKWCALETM